MTPEEIKAFTDWLTTPGRGGGGDFEIALGHAEKGRWYGVKRLLFHYTLATGDLGDKESITDRWCYETFDKAGDALVEWASRDFAGEPEGWHRHPLTGRRRTNGDPTQEYTAK